jgi:hypothetical protein
MVRSVFSPVVVKPGSTVVGPNTWAKGACAEPAGMSHADMSIIRSSAPAARLASIT